MLIDFFLLGIPLIWLGVASVIDSKTREVPDWLSYSLVLLGLTIRATYALLTKEFSFLLAGLIALPLAFLLGSFMYYTRQWGGGDSKLLIGLGVFFATTPTILQTKLGGPFLLIFLFNLVMVGALYGTGYMLFLAYKHKTHVFRELYTKNRKLLITLWTLFALGAVLAFFFITDPFLSTTTILTLFGLCLISLLLLLTKIVERTCMHKTIPVHHLREGDWLVNPVIVRGKTLVPAKTIGLEKKDIALLRTARVKNVLIKEGMPFVPAFFIAYICTILFGLLFFPTTVLLPLTAFFSAAVPTFLSY